MEKDPVSTIKSLAKMGYREVEGYGYNEGKMFGMPLKDYANLLKDNGISSPSCHIGISVGDWNASQKTISDNLKKTIDGLASIGQKYAVIPWIGNEERKRIGELAEALNIAGAYAQTAGIKMGYHNHDFEYKEKGPDGRLLIEWLLHETDPRLVAMEMDMYWVAFAQHQPLDWFRLYPGRWELCHVKDMAKTPERETIEVGDGIIDFNSIFKQSARAGLKYYIIELEHYRTTPLEGVKKARLGFLNVK
jgi:sugar phosphate isomerase/epimerase